MSPNPFGGSPPSIEHIRSADPSQLLNKPSISSFHPPALQSQKTSYKWNIVWRTVIILSIFHTFALVGLWLMLTRAMWKTILFNFLYQNVLLLGITAGVHRLWSHRSYKAKLPLKIFLMLCQTSFFQKDIYEWSRDHRVHHKFSDTDADPHNSRRGFFYSHMGWLFLRKHKDVLEKGKTIDMSDLKADPVVRFQRKYFYPMAVFLCLVVPTLIPWYFWNEDYYTSWYVTTFRYMLSLNITLAVNSVAHNWGTKPYDKRIHPSDNTLMSYISIGDGWHNYHHVFPWDYKGDEFGSTRFNFTSAFIDLMAWIGQAYDLKAPSKEMIEKRVMRTGDRSWKGLQDTSSVVNDDDDGQENNVWGWGDNDINGEVMIE